MSNVKKVKNGYVAYFSFGSGRTRVRKTKKLPTKKEATNWVIKQSLFYDGGKAQAYLEKMSVASYYNFWVDHHKKNVAKSTLLSYRATHQRLQMYLNKFSLVNVTHTQIEVVFNQLDHKYSKETLRKDLGHLKSMFNEAMRAGLIRATINPASDIVIRGNDFQTKKTADDRIIPMNQFNEIKGYLSKFELKAENHSRNILALSIASCTGLRGGEILGLRPCDIDWTKKSLSVNGSWSNGIRTSPKTKNGYREVPLESWVLSKIDDWLRLNNLDPTDDGPLLVRSDGSVGAVSSLTSAFKQLQKKLGYEPKFSIHDFRHTIASMLISKGANLVVVSRFLGHGSVRVTQEYYLGLVTTNPLDERRKLLGLLDSADSDGSDVL